MPAKVSILFKCTKGWRFFFVFLQSYSITVFFCQAKCLEKEKVSEMRIRKEYYYQYIFIYILLFIISLLLPLP